VGVDLSILLFKLRDLLLPLCLQLHALCQTLGESQGFGVGFEVSIFIVQNYWFTYEQTTWFSKVNCVYGQFSQSKIEPLRKILEKALNKPLLL